MQQTSDVNNDAEALCCFRLVQSVRVQNVTYRRKCHPTHWFRCEHYSEQPCTFVHTSTPWKTDWLGSQAVVTITLTVGIRTWVYQRSVLLPGLTSAVIYSETHKLVLSLKVYGIRCLVITLNSILRHFLHYLWNNWGRWIRWPIWWWKISSWILCFEK